MSRVPATFQSTLNKTKSRGYWKVVIEPTEKFENFFDHISDAKSFMRDQHIQLRGWDYPHYPTKNDDFEGINILSDRVNAHTDWNHYKEVWTYYSSGQFVHLSGLHEDWFGESAMAHGSHYARVEPMKYIDAIGAILRMTEIFKFIENLSYSGKYKAPLKITISLHNTAGRDLTTLDPGRAPIFQAYTYSDNELVLTPKIYDHKDLQEKGLEIAKGLTISLFKYFGWENPPVQVIEADQQRLVSRQR